MNSSYHLVILTVRQTLCLVYYLYYCSWFYLHSCETDTVLSISNDRKPLQYCKVISLQLIKINEKIFLKKGM